VDKKFDSLGIGYQSCTEDTSTPYYNPQKYIGPVVYAAYLLAYGGVHPNSGYMVDAIGSDKLAEILFHALMIELHGKSRTTFSDLYLAMWDAASCVYSGTQDLEKIRFSIMQAFLAVGIIAPPIIPPLVIQLIIWPWDYPSPEMYVPWGSWPSHYLDKALHHGVDPEPLPNFVYQKFSSLSADLMRKIGNSPDIAVNSGEALGPIKDFEQLKGPLIGGHDNHVFVRVRNDSDAKVGFNINLYVCEPDSLANLSSWLDIGSTHIDVDAKKQGIAQIVVAGERLSAIVKVANTGKACLIARYAPDSAYQDKGSLAMKLEPMAGQAADSCIAYTVINLQ
jgi:hypothetical protein